MKEKIPIETGKLYDVIISDLSHDGAGIARIDGFLVFICNGLPEERVIIKIKSVKKKYGYAEVVDQIKTSADRVIPPCPLFALCGGCQIQHLKYVAQLNFKKGIICRNIKKYAKIKNPPILDVIGMDEPWRYRNKTQVPFGVDSFGNVVAGFYKSRSHDIIDMPSCLVQRSVADDIINTVKKNASEYGVVPYNENAHTGELRHIVIRIGFRTNQIMVIFVTRTSELSQEEVLPQHIRESFPEVKSIVHNINPRATNVIFGEETHIIYGQNYIIDSLGEFDFLISPRSFYQINPKQTEIMYQLIVDYADIGATDIVFDAYCGIGTITLFLAKAALRVYGIEIIPDAIRDAKENAKMNKINNVHFEVGKSEIVLPRLISEGVVPNVIVVDPPRKGCDRVLLDAIIKAKPKRVVYVSCDSATLARDIKILVAGGYQLEILQPIDMFPQTSHIECVALLVLN